MIDQNFHFPRANEGVLCTSRVVSCMLCSVDWYVALLCVFSSHPFAECRVSIGRRYVNPFIGTGGEGYGYVSVRSGVICWQTCAELAQLLLVHKFLLGWLDWVPIQVSTALTRAHFTWNMHTLALARTAHMTLHPHKQRTWNKHIACTQHLLNLLFTTQLRLMTSGLGGITLVGTTMATLKVRMNSALFIIVGGTIAWSSLLISMTIIPKLTLWWWCWQSQYRCDQYRCQCHCHYRSQCHLLVAQFLELIYFRNSSSFQSHAHGWKRCHWLR